MAAKDFGTSHAVANTVIGESILIAGKLSGDEDLTVRGRVEGEVSLSKTLTVEQSGIVKAHVQVRHAIISGVVVGNITATECVELTKDGRTVGDIRSPRVIIVDGASFRGRVDMGEGGGKREGEERPQSRPTTLRPAVRAAAAPPRAPLPALTKAPVKSTSPAVVASKPAPPPMPPLMAEAAKKKVLVKKKK